MTAIVVLHCVVTRIEAKSEQFDMYMQLDVNTDIYPLHEGDKFMMVLASTLNLDGTPDTGYFTPVICFYFRIFHCPLIVSLFLVFVFDVFVYSRNILRIEGSSTLSTRCFV